MKCLHKLLKGLGASFAATMIVLMIVLGIGFILELIFQKHSAVTIIVYVAVYAVLIAMILLAMGIYMIFVMSAYHHAKGKLGAIPGFSEARFERETARSPQVESLLISSDAICCTEGGYLMKVIPVEDILWVYQGDVKGGGVCLQIHTKDRQKYTVPVCVEEKSPEREKKSEMAARYILRLIARKNKNALIGYDEELERLYKKDFGQLVRRASGREIMDSAMLEEEYIQNDYYHKDFQ